MTFKEFVIWCNERACDGCWGMNEATICIAIMAEVKNKPFWKRKKKWKMIEDEVVTKIVNPINKKIEELGVLHRTK